MMKAFTYILSRQLFCHSKVYSSPEDDKTGIVGRFVFSSKDERIFLG